MHPRLSPLLVALTVLFATTILPVAPAQAESFTYTFDYVQLPPHTTGNPPVPGGPFGTITISDNGTFTDRVNIVLTIENIPAPYTGVALEQFYLNFDFVPGGTVQDDFGSIGSGNSSFYLVTQGATADPTILNGNPFDAAETLGGVAKGNDTQTLGGGTSFTFDVSPDPFLGAADCPSPCYSFVGSLAFYDTLGNDTPINLDAAMFNLASGGSGDPHMYAAFRLVPGENPVTGASIGELFVFASSPVSPVPEPSSLLLLGTGLAGFGTWLKARRRVQRDSGDNVAP
jgi:PEP-CTERM motif